MQARSDVEIAVIEQDGQPVAFFPYHRSQSAMAIPIGSILSDYQALICAPEFHCNPLEILYACRLLSWDFDHLLTAQTFFAPFHHHQTFSTILELTDGFEAYRTRTHAARAELIKLRRLERDYGPVRFVAHSSNVTDLIQVLAWKSAQYLSTNKRDLFSSSWIRNVITQIHIHASKDFSGCLSLLYTGDRLIAGHFGMQAGAVWHYWFPAYDANFAQYSPGLILLLKMVEHAPKLGIRTIDFGKGAAIYKERFGTGAIAIAEGSVIRSSWLKIRRQIKQRSMGLARNVLLRTPWKANATQLWGYLRRIGE